MCVSWELKPQPLRYKRNALPLSHRNIGKQTKHQCKLAMSITQTNLTKPNQETTTPNIQINKTTYL